MPLKSTANQSSIKDLKTALVYDRANTPYGGAEQVLLTFQKMFPDLVLFTSVHSQKAVNWTNSFKEIRTSFLNKIPLMKSRHQALTALMPLAFESFDLSEFDLVISVTSAEAKGVITKPHQLHLCYLLTPPRYLYHFRDEYLKTRGALRIPPFKQISSLLLKYLEWWDKHAIFRPDVIIPLSYTVKKRAQEVYNIDTDDPIYPPVDAISLQEDNDKLTQLNLPDRFNLIVSRLVFYKRVDLAIQASAAVNQNLVIVGEGHQEGSLKKLAHRLVNKTNSKIIFLGSQPQSVVNSLMKEADLFLAPGIDDFGLSPLQANLFGTPALINSQSGVAEVFDQYGFGAVITKMSLADTAQKMHQASLLTKKSANIRHVKRDLGQEAFIAKISSVLAEKFNQKKVINHPFI